MDLSRPQAAVCPTLDTDVLTVLVGTSRPLSGREVARMVGRMSHEGVRQVLSRLTEHGMVDRQEAGGALLYTLNREHLAAPAVAILAGLRPELWRRLRDLIGSWDISPIHASVFGSAARGNGGTDSDIDIFIVRPDDVDGEDPIWRAQLENLATSVRRWTGNHAGISEVSKSEIPRLSKEQPPIVAQLKSDAVELSGPDIRALLNHPP
jgi:DNA-binding transcriptional ArsR family regulator